MQGAFFIPKNQYLKHYAKSMVLFLCLCNVLRNGDLSDEEGIQGSTPNAGTNLTRLNGKNRHDGIVE